MSKASKILNIFILLFSICAVVFSTLLFMKREEITQSRRFVASTVEKITKQMGVNSVRADDLKINKKPSDVKEAMTKLEVAVDKVVKQRDAVSETLAVVTNNVLEKAYIPVGEDAYTADKDVISSYKGTDSADALTAIKSKISNRMTYIYDREDKLTAFVTKNGSILKLDSSSSPDNEKLQKTFLSINDKSQDVVKRMESFQTHIASVTSKISPDSPELNLTIEEYSQLLNQNLTTIQDYVNVHNSLLKEREELLARAQRAEALVGEAEVDSAKFKTVAEEAEQKRIAAEKEVARLRKIIDPDGNDSNTLEKLNINFTILKELTGKIVYVNPTYGIVTIDMGEENDIVRSTGEHVHVSLPENALITVATSLDPTNAKYVCKGQIVKIHPKASVATILTTPEGKINMPKIGDVVYFSNSDIARMKEINAENIRKFAEARAAAERERAAQDYADFSSSEDEEENGDDSGIEASDDNFINEEAEEETDDAVNSSDEDSGEDDGAETLEEEAEEETEKKAEEK